MAVTISQFTISTFDLFGFSPPVFAGFSDVIGSGTINQSEKYLVAFGGNGVRGLFWQNGTSAINFEVYGLHENSGWDYITINGVNYNRSSATYSRFTVADNSSANYPTGGGEEGGPYTRWSWTGVSSFPFASSSSGATQAMYVKHSGSMPASGALSLNTIHTVAGGSSGTSVGLNDSDVRALNWYNTVAGSPIASGGTNAMQEYYYPCNVGENQGYTRRRLFSTTSNDLNYKLGSALATITQANISGIFTQVKCGMTIEFDGTDTRLRFHLFSVVNYSNTAIITLSNQYWNSEASGTGSPQTYSATANDAILFEGVQVKQAALLTSQHNESIDSSVGAKTYNTSQFGETLMSTNSITSFVDISPNTQYGRSFNVRNTVNPQNQVVGNKISKVDCRFRWALRLLGYSPADRTFIEKDTTLNFMISLYTLTNRQ
jgi:hypothetical protein